MAHLSVELVSTICVFTRAGADEESIHRHWFHLCRYGIMARASLACLRVDRALAVETVVSRMDVDQTVVLENYRHWNHFFVRIRGGGVHPSVWRGGYTSVIPTAQQSIGDWLSVLSPETCPLNNDCIIFALECDVYTKIRGIIGYSRGQRDTCRVLLSQKIGYSIGTISFGVFVASREGEPLFC